MDPDGEEGLATGIRGGWPGAALAAAGRGVALATAAWLLVRGGFDAAARVLTTFDGRVTGVVDLA